MTVNSGAVRAGLAVVVLTVGVGAGVTAAEEPVLRLRAAVVGRRDLPLTIELWRWSSDAERAPLLAALSAPPAPPAAQAGGRGGRAGRAGRGGRGGEPPRPADSLTAAIKAAPTVGFIWGEGPTGYSIRYAWRMALPDGHERIVLATDRRLGAHAPSWPLASGGASDADYTVMEVRFDGTGVGGARTSLSSRVVIDAAAKTLALDAIDATPVQLEVTR